MHEKKPSEKPKEATELDKLPTEILVARGRSFEPFIKTFVQSGENVSRLDLGTLVGVFEVDERSEDSAYIVNFLASVAKKEYFSNPRRGAIESFEAALHKVNLALAELVKHGNVAWLGRFHGVIGSFEKGGLHFSATGEGSILLLRDGTLSDISEGLASDEASVHPIKTFTEISSGRLIRGDRIIFSSPELLRLFSTDDLLKNALRMDEGRFDQFLKTALVNELDMAGTIVMHIKEASPIAKKAPERKHEPSQTADAVRNVFSQSAFSKKETRSESIAEAVSEKEARNDYVDSKTGHIYVQGNDPVEPAAHPLIERLGLFAQELGASVRSSVGTQSKWFRRTRKQLAIGAAEALESVRSGMRHSVTALRRRAEKRRQERLAETAAKEQASPLPAAPAQIPTAAPQPETPAISAALPAADIPEETEIPLFIREKLAAFYRMESRASKQADTPVIEIRETEIARISLSEKTVTIISSALRTVRPAVSKTASGAAIRTGNVLRTLKRSARRVRSAYAALTPKQKKAVLGIGAAGVVALSVLPFLKKDSVENPDVPTMVAAEESEASFSPQEKLARTIGSLPKIATHSGLSSVVSLDGRTYAISPDSITDIADAKDYALPEGSGRITFSAPMDDLRLVFLSTDRGELFAWSPISRTFAKNTLSLPSGAAIRSIGTYLTYLYVLDSANGQIYRFPRADGGFGAPTSWLRDTIVMNESSMMSVSENILVSRDGSSLESFFRGRSIKNFEAPNEPLAITSIAATPDTSAAYALDAGKGRIVAWDKDGAITAQYFSEQLKGASAITWNTASNELVIAVGDTILSLKP